MPSRSNSRTPSGVIATRYSLFLISLGTPTVRITGEVMGRHLAPGGTVDQRPIVRQDERMAKENMAVDAIDRRIIGILQHHGRISWRELADAVHMASSSVADRVRRLEAGGVIRGYRAEHRSRRAWTRCARRDRRQPACRAAIPAAFEARLAERDEVELALYVTGPADYTVIVDCVGAEGLDGFIRWLKAEGGVARTESKFVLRPVIG